MSLKAFHLLFITAACALAVGFGIWELKDYWSVYGSLTNLLCGIGSFLVAGALMGYERYFLKKSKNISYL